MLEAIKRPYELLPEGKKIVLVCLDSEYYRADVMEYLRERGTSFGIVVDKDVAVKEAKSGIKEWRTFRDRDGIITERKIGEIVHTMNRNNNNAFSMKYLKTEDYDF
ncbi:MAG: hypothetical protein RMI63_04035 [Caldimicrobium sp.]|nr:hypothetical protein [Dictyoglomus thermophilum]MCS7200430.1 hypothetical protein [Caldimicrobium sp.]MCX7719992.1 hypothetical protein [Dictyoglomus thermophilum]MDW8094182.1 hypothetical protein [Caldimicrobium sp.]